MSDALAAALQQLKSVFGYDHFRGQQAEIIGQLLAGGDALVLMPTGGGKSLCYQLPALLREGTAIVVSPLIALMQDQVSALQQLGVRAACLNSSLSADAAREAEQALLAGTIDLLYVAPERLLTGRFMDLLQRSRLALFAIDEAHCVSQWGHDFRPEYRELACLHERWPEVPRIALTATADAPTRQEIIEQLALQSARQYISSFDRPNIDYQIELKHDGRRQLLAYLREHAGECGIIYALSRKRVDETAALLQAEGFPALPYHAGLDAATRAQHQERFLREDGIIMVATIAFGMGIDKPDVRFVAHLDLPRSLEGYYQETGRAGRDGEPAQAWMLYGLADVVGQRRLIDGSESGEARKRIERSKLDALLGFCESLQCRRVSLLAYFGESYPGACGRCDNCRQPPQSWDATEAAQMALSCVWRTGQRFGVSHLIDVLLGKTSERVEQLGHDRLTTFGIGSALDAQRWRSVFRQLVASGYLCTDLEGYGGLRLSESARPLLRGEQPLRLRLDPPRQSRGRQRRTPSATAPIDLSTEQQRLFEALRAMRARLAGEQSVPAYVIFHDSTLREIALNPPASLGDLADISGVGSGKLERYGQAVLETLQDVL
ncbi:MAG: DNA helicase RecQ [Xanthomonadales bacterium]|nr:DNA helicase RecQ [Xanthomonadales bacterium]